ncbi:MAG: hypothetical protein WCD35_03465 [Mycobacteriales bacterium]
MPERTSTVQEVRAVLAKWTANDWRRAFALADGLDGSIRQLCHVPRHEPLESNTGALAMPVLTHLGQLELDDLVLALAPLALELEARLDGADSDVALKALREQEDVGPGLANLAGLRLALHPSIAQLPAEDTRDLPEVVAALEELQPKVVAAAQQLLADAEAGRPTREADLAPVRGWNDDLARAAGLARTAVAATSLASLQALLAERAQAASAAESTEALVRVLCEIADATVTEGARVVLADVLAEAAAAAADPEAVTSQSAFRALHRLLSQQSWEVSDADVEVVEEAFGRKVARVAVAEVAISGRGPR